MKAELEELRVLFHATPTVVPGEKPSETTKLYWLEWIARPETIARVPVPEMNGLFTGTICESIETVPVTAGSKLNDGTLACEKGRLAPAVPRPKPPAAVFSKSVSANHTL